MGKQIPLAERLALARARDTPPSTLSDLAAHAPPYLRLTLAGNPNAPAALLSALAGDDREIIRAAVAKSPNAPAQILERLANDPRLVVRRNVATNPETPPATLELLVGDACRDVHLALVENPRTPIAVFERLIDLLDPPGRKRMAGAMPCYPPILKRLAVDPSPKVRFKIPRNPNLDEPMWLWLVENGDPELQLSVALHGRNLPPQAFSCLMETNAPDIRAALARNPTTPARLLWQIFDAAHGMEPDGADDAHRHLLTQFCYNSGAPEALLVRLARGYPALRSALGYNENASPELLDILAEDEASIARWAAARHRSTPPASLAKLTRDENCLVRRDAFQNAATPEEDRTDARMAVDPDWQIRNRVAGNPETAPEILTLLAADVSRDVRASVAGNPATPIRTIAFLMRSKDRWMWARAARNPNAPPEELRRLWKGGDESLAAALAANPGTPPDILDTLSRHPDAMVKWNALLNKSTPLESLTDILASGERPLRKKIAKIVAARKKEDAKAR